MSKILNFETGKKIYTVNGVDIEIDTSDLGIMTRLSEALDAIGDKKNQFDIPLKPNGEPEDDATDAVIATLKELDSFIKDQIDYALNSKVSEKIFGSASTLSTYKGVPLFERFINCIFPEIEKDIENEMQSSKERMNKYMKEIEAIEE